MPPAAPPSRRLFLGLLAGAPAVPAALAAAGPLPLLQSPAPTPAAAASEKVAEALTEVVRSRFGGQLDAAALAEILEGIQNAQRAAARLRGLKLGNGDEPVTVFEPRPPVARG